MVTTAFVVLVAAVIAMFLWQRKRQTFGLNELRAALEIDAKISPRSLRAIVVGALGYNDRVIEDINKEKASLRGTIEAEKNAVIGFREDVDKIRKKAEEDIEKINVSIVDKEDKINKTKGDLGNLEALESRIDS